MNKYPLYIYPAYTTKILMLPILLLSPCVTNHKWCTRKLKQRSLSRHDYLIARSLAATRGGSEISRENLSNW
jgi:hypothetical protein